MKLLLRMALRSKRHLYIVLCALFFMICDPISAQLEIMALGVVAQTSVDFFTLFSPENKPTELVTKEQVASGWDLIDKEGKGAITKKDAMEHLSSSHNLLMKLIQKINRAYNMAGSYQTLIIVILSISFFKALVIFGGKFFAQLLSIRVSRDLRQSYFEHMQILPMSFYQQHNIGALSSRIVTDASLVAASINAMISNYLRAPFLIISTFLLCLSISVELSLIVLIGIPFVGIPIVMLTRRVKRISRSIQKNQEVFTSLLIDFLAGIQTVKIFATEALSLRKYREQNEKMTILEEKSSLYSSIARPILHFIGGLFLASIIIYGVVVLGLTIPDLIVFCGFLIQFYEPIKRFGEENLQIQRGIVAAERMHEVLNIQLEVQDQINAKPFEGVLDEITFEDVWFKYENSWILKGISFSLKKGQTLAIVWPTGSGKSTLALLIPRLWDVQKGQITLNGKSLKDYTQKTIREQIAFVPQKPYLFLDTIKENISFGSDYSEMEIRKAISLAYADEFINNMPKGYDQHVAEAGKNLSGGQQQRIAIARALLKKAQLLIMDEATSSLDAISENHIKIALKQMKELGMTQIIIAHRLSTIESADKIIYLEKGEKIAEGTREELLETCQGFKAMWDMMKLSSYNNNK